MELTPRKTEIRLPPVGRLLWRSTAPTFRTAPALSESSSLHSAYGSCLSINTCSDASSVHSVRVSFGTENVVVRSKAVYDSFDNFEEESVALHREMVELSTIRPLDPTASEVRERSIWETVGRIKKKLEKVIKDEATISRNHLVRLEKLVETMEED